MANLTIKGLPDPVHKDLKRVARFEGQSLNSYVISLLQMSVDERQRRKLMRQGRESFREFVASLPRLADGTRLLRSDRDRGH